MLFTQHINTLNSGISNIQTQIDELESQLRTLRSHKAEFESELQQILTLEGAAESALNQSQMFINAAESLGRTDLIQTFWDAMDAMQSPITYQLPEATDTPESEPSEPITPTEPDTDSPIEVTVAPSSDDNLPYSDILGDLSPSPDTTPESNPRTLASGECAAFNPSEASMDDLKRYVRGHWNDEQTKRQGSLTRRTTWEAAANQILESQPN
ncbi:MAG: hypothetical protein ACRCT1_19335 [Microcoleaceae cyanobacterium]